MQQRELKIAFWILATLLLLVLARVSRDAGISGDEEVHYLHSEMVYNYFSTVGQDQSSLYTPKTHLQYYGQAFDNLVTILIHWFSIEDIYGFRHLMSSICGWGAMVVTALFAAHLSGYGAAIIVLLLFALSPVFLGHSQNNLKDIPFALAYIASIYYSLKIVYTEEKVNWKSIILLILGIAFAIGIRPGGLLAIFYLGFFMFVKGTMQWIKTKTLDLKLIKQYLGLFALIAVSGYLLGLILWPYALQNPLLHPWKSYQVMTSFPTTVRQIFEGHFDWSDFHPWYYLPKYMLITIPLLTFAGIAAFILLFKKSFSDQKKIQLLLVVFTILFPIVFVLIKGSNLYGSWRHFLFVYPALILLSGLGIQAFFIRFKGRLIRVGAMILLLVLGLHPLKFMASNHPYYYLYYNEFTAGLKGAYTRYETDYYYHSMREGAQWLQQYLQQLHPGKKVVVGGNFPIQWYFRKDQNIDFVYVPYQTRSNYHWDFLIVANSYIPPSQLREKIFPPFNTIHTVEAEGVPICAVMKRMTWDDLQGLRALAAGENIKSSLLLAKAVEADPQNEWICYKFAQTLAAQGLNDKATQALKQCTEINPLFEPALMMLGAQALGKGDPLKAAGYYKNAIRANRKHFDAYVQLAGLYAETNVALARKILKDCLQINSKYKPALRALADSYRETAPEVAKKYDQLINTLK